MALCNRHGIVQPWLSTCQQNRDLSSFSVEEGWLGSPKLVLKVGSYLGRCSYWIHTEIPKMLESWNFMPADNAKIKQKTIDGHAQEEKEEEDEKKKKEEEEEENCTHCIFPWTSFCKGVGRHGSLWGWVFLPQLINSGNVLLDPLKVCVLGDFNPSQTDIKTNHHIISMCSPRDLSLYNQLYCRQCVALEW